MKTIYLLIILFLNLFIQAQTLTGFTTASDACGSAPTVNLTTATTCTPASNIPSFTTSIDMSNATFAANTGVLPNCNGGIFGGVAMTSAMTDKWIKFTTSATVQGMALNLSGGLAVGTNSTTNFNIALYKTTSCPGSATNPIEIQWSANTPSTTTCNNVAIMASTFATDPYYIDLDPSSTYYMRIYSTAITGHNDISFNMEILPLPSPPNNGNNTSGTAPCANATTLTASTSGCNYGALPSPFLSGSSFITPGGCSWTRAENSQFYVIKRPAVGQFTVQINNVSCTGGGSAMQAAIFRGCPVAVTNYSTTIATTNGSCVATSSGTTNLVVNDGVTDLNQDYYIWVDGVAASVCNYGVRVVSVNGILPVDLTAFNIKCSNDLPLITWSTASEQGNQYFTIMRSVDGVNFNPIATINSQGNSLINQHYSYIDQNPLQGLVYYKLKQTNLDNNEKEFSAKSYFKNCSNLPFDIISLTNPFSNELNLNLKTTVFAKITMSIYDALGQEVKKVFNETLLEGETTKISINTNELSQSVYFLSGYVNNEPFNLKLIKAN